MFHRARELAMKQRTAHGNQIRGLLAEYGIVVGKGLSHLNELPEVLEKAEDKLSMVSKEIFLQLYEQLKTYAEQVEYYEKKIYSHASRSQSYMRRGGPTMNAPMARLPT